MHEARERGVEAGGVGVLEGTPVTREPGEQELAGEAPGGRGVSLGEEGEGLADGGDVVGQVGELGTGNDPVGLEEVEQPVEAGAEEAPVLGVADVGGTSTPSGWLTKSPT